MCHFWDKECETFYRSFTRAPVGTDSDGAASSLLSQLVLKKQEWWEEAVNSIDFSYSTRKAWRTINKLSGRSGRSFHQCPVLANSIASQLVKNGAHRTGDRESTRLVNKELSNLWKMPTQHLRVTVSLNPLGWRSFLPSSDAWSQESLWDWTPSSITPRFESSYSTPGRLSNLGSATSSVIVYNICSVCHLLEKHFFICFKVNNLDWPSYSFSLVILFKFKIFVSQPFFFNDFPQLFFVHVS